MVERIKSTIEKVLVITGATSGIGYEIFKKCNGDYTKIFVLTSNADQAETDPLFLTQNVRLMTCNLSDLTQVESCGQKIKTETSEIESVFFCAGQGSYSQDLSLESIQNVFHVNFLSHVLLYGLLKDKFSPEKNSHVLLISSSASFKFIQDEFLYALSKECLNNLSRFIRKERQKLTSVTVVYPSATRTSFWKKAGYEHLNRSQDGMLDPELVALKALTGVSKRRKSVLVGKFTFVQFILYKIVPRDVLQWLSDLFKRLYKLVYVSM